MKRETQEKKKEFVKYPLSQLIRYIDRDIDRATYEADDDGEEYVFISYKTSAKRIKVIVTADSLSAIVNDVLSAIN